MGIAVTLGLSGTILVGPEARAKVKALLWVAGVFVPRGSVFTVCSVTFLTGAQVALSDLIEMLAGEVSYLPSRTKEQTNESPISFITSIHYSYTSIDYQKVFFFIHHKNIV